MRNFFPLIALTFILFPGIVSAQKESHDPGWQWGRLTNIENSGNDEIKTNFFNDIYSLESYIDTIYIEDTAFFHPGGYPNQQDFNLALIKRNSKGEFVKAIDIFTPQNKRLYYADMELDSESNIYLYGAYDDTIFINDNILPPVYYPQYGDVFLIKLDKELNFKWAKTIAYRGFDYCSGMGISKDNFIYLSTYHMPGSYDTLHYYVNFFGQDSTEILTGVISLLKVDTEGNIIWRNEIRKPVIGTGFMRNTLVGGDGNIYIEGNVQSHCDLYFPDDTLEFPHDPEYANDSFIALYNPEGDYLNAFFYAKPDIIVISNNFFIDENGNYYINAIVVNSIVFGTDYLELTGNEIDYLIAKMDTAFYPIWYERLRYMNGGGERIMLTFDDERLAFAFHGTGHFTFMDSSYAYNANGQVLSGLFNPEGDLEEFQITESSFGTKLCKIHIDNCKNLLLDGLLQGTAHFGDDTINAGYGFHRFLAKNNRFPLSYIEMPVDIAGCDSVVLYAPEGYLNYQWNCELSDRNWLIVNNSGVVNLKAANEDGCWAEGETTVTIYPEIIFSLGPDHTILLTDTLELSAPGGYEHYQWSTGDTIPDLLIYATQLQIGDNLIWLDIENGLCSASDTILVKVIDNSIIPENSEASLIIYPNPATKSFQIISSAGIIPETVILYKNDGKEILKQIQGNDPVDVRNLQRGVYIVQIEFQGFTIRKKLIVL
jgi:hypothetical protein